MFLKDSFYKEFKIHWCIINTEIYFWGTFKISKPWYGPSNKGTIWRDNRAFMSFILHKKTLLYFYHRGDVLYNRYTETEDDIIYIYIYDEGTGIRLMPWYSNKLRETMRGYGSNNYRYLLTDFDRSMKDQKLILKKDNLQDMYTYLIINFIWQK